MKRMKKLFAFITAIVMIFTIWQPATTFAAAKKAYTISGRTLVPTVKSGKDISKNVNTALKEAKRLGAKGKVHTVKIPKGTYYISESLKIWSNTKLNATGCVIKTKKIRL